MVDYFGADLWGGPGTVVPDNTVDGHHQRGGLVFLLSVVGCGDGDHRFMVVLLLQGTKMRCWKGSMQWTACFGTLGSILT